MPETVGPIARLKELIEGLNIAVFTTQRSDGKLQSCPMASRGIDETGTLWFLSDNNTEKVEAVRSNAQVNVAYADHAAQRYVSISGYCELVRDQGRAKQLWDSSYSQWFPRGLDDPALILLKVSIQQASYWDANLGRMVPLLGLTRVQ